MLDNLNNLVTVLVSLSVASERLVEIIKSWIPWLNTKQLSDSGEDRRRAAVQIMAGAAGVAPSSPASPVLDGLLKTTVSDKPWVLLGLGLLASGGSGMWNSALSY